MRNPWEAAMLEKLLPQLEKGDLFGEVAFFRASGKRSATVKALTDGRLLVLRRKFLKEMAKRDPDTAFNILFNLGSMLSERFVAIRSLIV
jgi:CRP-like cAMP-binding protein